MVSDGVGGYHGRSELGLLRGRDQGIWECVQCVACFVRVDGLGQFTCFIVESINQHDDDLGRGWGGGRGGVLPDGPHPLRRQHRKQSLGPARHQGGSSSVALLLVAERIVCAVVAAPTATPASVVIGGRCLAPPEESERTIRRVTGYFPMQPGDEINKIET
jgi:hypothetical protein